MVGERKMNIENKILIHSLECGYIVTYCTSGRKYAKETAEGVIEVIREALGISKPEPESQEKVCKCMQQKEEPVKIEEPEKKILPVPNISKQDSLIPRFKYDHSLRKSIPDYKNTWYAELPDGRVVLGYGVSSYYTTKEKVMQLPSPVPYGYFKKSGVSTTAQTCLRAYRNLLYAAAFCEKAGKNENDDDKEEEVASDYVSKSTQDRIREAAEQKAERRRKMEDCKNQTEMSEKTKKLREMTIRMGVQ